MARKPRLPKPWKRLQNLENSTAILYKTETPTNNKNSGGKMRNPILFLIGLVMLWSGFGLQSPVISNETVVPEAIIQETAVEPEITIEPEITAEPEIKYVEAWINADEPEIVVDVYYSDKKTERFSENLESGAQFTKTYGDFAVDALFIKTNSGIISYCNVTNC
jgi:hypothetical protein